MAEQFIGAAIEPVAGTFDTAGMSRGEPGLPRQFRWRSRTIEVARVLRAWRQTGPCHHGSGEQYVRKHWFEVLAASGEVMTLYFERRSRSRTGKSRWWLFTLEPGEERDERLHDPRTDAPEKGG